MASKKNKDIVTKNKKFKPDDIINGIKNLKKEPVVYPPEVVREVIDKITTARTILLFKQPFYGNMTTRMEIIEDNTFDTAATNGRVIYFNTGFFKDLTVENIEFVLCHEILHLAFDHFCRRDNRNPKIWNYATDYCINGILVVENIGEPIKDFRMFHDPKYYNMSSEEIYELIKDDYDSGKNIELGDLLDNHIDWEENDENGNPRMTPDEIRQVKDEIRQAIIQAAQACGSGYDIPSSIKELIDDMTNHKIPWEEVIRQQIKSLIKYDCTYMKPNKKSYNMEALLPGSDTKYTIDVAIGIDMSGSIGSKEAKNMLTEVKGIMEEFQEFTIKLWCFDDVINNYKEYNSYNMDEFDDYEPIGNGGTNFHSNFEFMEQFDVPPKKFICMTDGYPNGTWCPTGMENFVETIWLIHGNTTIVAPFGETIYYDI